LPKEKEQFKRFLKKKREFKHRGRFYSIMLTVLSTPSFALNDSDFGFLISSVSYQLQGPKLLDVNRILMCSPVIFWTPQAAFSDHRQLLMSWEPLGSWKIQTPGQFAV